VGGALEGIRALVTRPAGQAGPLVAAIRAGGGEAAEFPLLEIVALDAQASAAIDETLNRLETFDAAIFISTNAVRALLTRLADAARTWPARLQCFAIGRATAQCLREAGIECESAAAAMDSEALLAHPALAAVADRRIVIFKGVGGRELLARRLAERGATVTECALYRRRLPGTASREALHALLRERAINVVLLSSAEALANLLGLPGADAAGTIPADLTLVTSGERVAAQARDAGFIAVEPAANATDAAMLAALERLAATIRRRVHTT
jgi:uroporphyrinogen-III synthase